MANYELTTYGMEQRKTLGARLQDLWEALPKKASPTGSTKLVRSARWERLNKQAHILEYVYQGMHPIDESYGFLADGPQKTRAKHAMQKELDSMIQANMIRGLP